MPIPRNPKSQRGRARAAGIPYTTFARREQKVREAHAAANPAPELPTWIGKRIYPPLEPEHPQAVNHDRIMQEPQR